MQSGNRQIFIAIFLVFIVLAGLIFYLESQRLTNEDLEATVDSRVAAVLTDVDYDSTNVARANAAAATNVAIADALGLTAEAQRPIVLTDVAIFYPSNTPTNTPTNTATFTPTNAATHTPAPTATLTPITFIQSDNSTTLEEFASARLFKWSPDGSQFIFVTDDNQILLTSTDNYVVDHQFYSQLEVELIDWTSSGTYFAAVNYTGTTIIWDVPKRVLVHSNNVSSQVLEFAWSPRSDSFAVAWHGGLEIYSVDNRRRPIAEYTTGRSPQIAWIGEDSYSSYSLLIFHDGGAESIQYQTDTIITYDNVPTNVSEVVARPDGERVAVVSNDTEVYILDMTQPDAAITFSASDTTVHTLDWSPDGHYIVTGDDNGNVRIWDAQTGELIQNIQQEKRINYVEWSPAGDKIAILSNRLSIWQLDIEAD